MKKLALAATLSFLAIAGCDQAAEETTPDETTPDTTSEVPVEEAAPREDVVTATTKEGLIEATFPLGWYENPSEHPYDLQYFSEDQRTNTGIFVYRREDFAEEMTTDSLLEFQIEDLGSKRENFEVVEPKSTTELSDKTITTAAYAGGKDTSRFNYKFTVIEFTENPDVLAVTLQVTFPSEWEQKKPILVNITEDLQLATAPVPAPESGTETETETPEAAPE